MHILIVSATHFEVKPLLDHLEINGPVKGINAAGRSPGGNSVEVLVTGIGMVNTALMMGRHVQAPYDLLINAGVCGAFNYELALGQLVNVTEDILSELGAEDGDAFLTYDALGLPGKHMFHASSAQLPFQVEALPKVKGITVNTVHGREKSIRHVKQIYAPDVESMEGAAFFAACEGQAKHYMQLRAISNYVEKRDKSKWQMPLAIRKLNDFLIELINDV